MAHATHPGLAPDIWNGNSPRLVTVLSIIAGTSGPDDVTIPYPIFPQFGSPAELFHPTTTLAPSGG